LLLEKEARWAQGGLIAKIDHYSKTHTILRSYKMTFKLKWGSTALLTITALQATATTEMREIFPPQKEYNMRASNIQFFDAEDPTKQKLFAVWHQEGSGEDGYNIQIFGSFSQYPPQYSHWLTPTALTSLKSGDPDQGLALYIDKNHKINKFYLFWTKMHDQTSGEAEARFNHAIFKDSLRSMADLKWVHGYADPVFVSESVSKQPGVLFSEISWLGISQQLSYTWPLVEGEFRPDMFENGPQVTPADMRLMYKELKKELKKVSASSFALFQSLVTKPAVCLSDDLKALILKASNFTDLFNSYSSTRPMDFRSLLSFAYWSYDTINSIKVKETLLNSKSKYYKGSWKTRSNPIKIELANGGERLLLPLYSDLVNFSLIVYSDDQGGSWHRAQTPIMSRGAVQPALAQLEDGTLVAYMRNKNGILNKNRALISYSSDEGKNWTPAIPSTSIRNRNSNLSMMKLAYGPHCEAIALAYSPDSERKILRIALSKDGGINWHQKTLLESSDDSEERYEYPSLTQSADGMLHLSFTRILDKGACSGESGTKECQHIAVISLDPSSLY